MRSPFPLLFAVSTVLILAPQAHGQETEGDRRTFGSVGIFFPVDTPSAVDATPGFSASLRRKFTFTEQGSWGWGLHFSGYGANNSQEIFLLQPELEYSPNLRAGRLQGSVGFGPLFTWNSQGGDAADMGVSVSARYALSRSSLAELRYQHGPKRGQRGLTLSYVFAFGR